MAAVILGASLATSACSDERVATSPSPPLSRGDLLGALIPGGAAQVGVDGRLQLAAPVETGRPQISDGRAEALAVGLAKFHLPYSRETLDRQHGGPIAYQNVAVCGRTTHATAAFERLPIDDPMAASLPLQKALGPWWLVTLCAPGGEPQLRVAVSAYSTDLGIMTTGKVDFPAIGGNDFIFEGIAPAGTAEDLPSAEEAVVLAAKLSGRRVMTAPELVAPFYQEDSPLAARWRVRLESPTRVRTATGGTIESSTVYVGRVPRRGSSKERTWAASPTQPADVDVLYYPLLRVGEKQEAYAKRQQAEMRMLKAVRKADVPITFTAGTIAP